MEHQKRQNIKRYFTQFPKQALYAVLAGILILLTFSSAWFIYIPLIVIGSYFLSNYVRRPEDRQMDEWLAEDLNNIKLASLKKTKLDDTELVRDSVMIFGRRYNSVARVDFLQRRGNDNIFRFSPIEVSVIHFTQHQLVIYQCAYDWTTSNALNVRVKRYFYEDVVSAETESIDIGFDEHNLDKKYFEKYPDAKKYIVNGKLQLNQAETFQLTTRGNTGIKVVLKDPNYIESIGTNSWSSSMSEEAIDSINKMLLAKKSTRSA